MRALARLAWGVAGLACLLGASAVPQDKARKPEPWLRFSLAPSLESRVELTAIHSGATGRGLEFELSRSGSKPTRTKASATVPDGDLRVALDVPRGEGPLRLVVRDKRGSRELLDAELEPTRVDWVACGPFPVQGNGLDKELVPHGTKLDFGASYDTQRGTVRWRPFDARLFADDKLADLDALFGPIDHAAVYLATVWNFEKPTKALLELGSDDYLQVVLNGREIHRSKAPRGALPGQDKVAASFKKGDNVLLFKVVDEGGAFTFCFRAKGEDGAPLVGFTPRGVTGYRWKTAAPPRVTSVEAGRAVLEFDSDAPELARAVVRRAASTPPDPREWLTRGLAFVLPLDVRERIVPGDDVARTHHRIVIDGLAPGERVGVAGLLRPPGVPPDTSPARIDRTTAWRVLCPPAASGKVLVSHLRLAAVFFADVVERGRGEALEAPKEELERRIAEAREQFDETRRFYFVHSGGRLSLDVTSFVDWEKHVVAPDTDYGFAYSGDEWKAVERVLGEAKRSPRDFDGYLLVSCDRAHDGSAWRFPGSGGGTYGPLEPFGATKSGWKLGSEDSDWLFCHEFGHGLDAMFAESGYPEFSFNHFYAFDDTAHVHGEHWDGNGWLLREWGGHARRDAQAKWQPGELGWRWFTNAWGTVKEYADADGDGLADASDALPLDEARFGSSPASADGDGDGLGDLAELMQSAWLVHGLHEFQAGDTARTLDPTRADTDGDGKPDGTDPAPLWPVGDDLGAPLAFHTEDPAFGAIELEVAWRDGALRFDVRTAEPFERVRVMLDAKNDGWYVGGDNLVVECTPTEIAHRDLNQCSVADTWGFSQPENAPAEMFELVPHDERSLSLAIRPRAASGFDATPGRELGFLVALLPPGGEVLRAGHHGWITVFEPHTFFRTRLPAKR
ncbi:MAG: hypothetical protein IT453_00300 [Planctomycetes bacterium]|nr:hypothetical protein [Planctomycetota bacterium]